MIRIGELARRSGVPPKTLRYYDQIDLLRPARRDPVTGIREYGEEALARLTLIRSARKAGLSLGEIKEILASMSRKSRAPLAYSILDRRVRVLERHSRALRDLRRRLDRLGPER